MKNLIKYIWLIYLKIELSAEMILFERISLYFFSSLILFACAAICIYVKLVEEGWQKEWYRQMCVALHKLTGESEYILYA